MNSRENLETDDYPETDYFSNVNHKHLDETEEKTRTYPYLL